MKYHFLAKQLADRLKIDLNGKNIISAYLVTLNRVEHKKPEFLENTGFQLKCLLFTYC
jgi:hypothetical protein